MPEVTYDSEGLLPVLRRLEDRIRELCAKTLTTRGPELDSALEDLKSALHEHA